ncbi:MAG TPA: hypothetical protein VMZ28_12100 [Kofleriaceae bacterium]|nr:hypothetical protein [Kofleriaceae bacterium]
MNPGTGADIESLCSKCGDVWHVVVAKVGDDVVKVQCKECGAYHRHRPPGGKAATAARKPRAAAGSKRSTPLGRGPAPPPPRAFAPDPMVPARPYSMRETFQPGEQIAHPRFGVGLVERSSEPGKISVMFSDGPRVLAVAKPDRDEHARIAPAPVVVADDPEA